MVEELLSRARVAGLALRGHCLPASGKSRFAVRLSQSPERPKRGFWSKILAAVATRFFRVFFISRVHRRFVTSEFMASGTGRSSKETMRHDARPRSTEMFERGKKILVGGVDSPVRAFRAVGGTPLIIDRARGARLYDVDGREYIDYVCSWGALILGHAHPDVVAAVAEQAARARVTA